MSRRRVAAYFAAAVLAGGAFGLLAGLLIGGRSTGAPPAAVETWPVVYRCGVVWQPEDLDDRSSSSCCAEC